jgi:hypothetical protein
LARVTAFQAVGRGFESRLPLRVLILASEKPKDLFGKVEAVIELKDFINHNIPYKVLKIIVRETKLLVLTHWMEIPKV